MTEKWSLCFVPLFQAERLQERVEAIFFVTCSWTDISRKSDLSQ